MEIEGSRNYERGVVSVPLIIDDDHEIVEHLESMVHVCITHIVTILTRPEIYFSHMKESHKGVFAGFSPRSVG